MEGLSTLDRDFVAALAHVQEFGPGFQRKDILALHGMEKQALLGDCKKDKTMAREIKDPKERRKVEAWIKCKGVSPDHSKELYIAKLKSISPEFDPTIAIMSNPGATEVFRRKLIKPPVRSVRSDNKALKRNRRNKKIVEYDDFDIFEGNQDKRVSERVQEISKQSLQVGRMTYDQLEHAINTPRNHSIESFPPPPPPPTASMTDEIAAAVERNFSQQKPYKKTIAKPKQKRNPLRSTLKDISIAKSSDLKGRRTRDTKGTGQSFTTDDYKVVYDQVIRFYEMHNPSMLTKGIEQHVLWALTKGVDRLDRKLRKKYQEGLPPPRTATEITEVPLPQKSLHQHQNEEKVKRIERIQSRKEKSSKSKRKTKRTTTEQFMSDKLLKEELIKPDNSLPRKQQSKDVLEFKKRLTLFLLEKEPERIEQCITIMMKFFEKKGVNALNKKLIKNYGEGIDTTGLFLQEAEELLSPRKNMRRQNFRVSRREQELVRMDDEDIKMLTFFFIKNDPGILEEEQVSQVQKWANRHGMASLNRQLKRKYKQDLDDFIFFYNKLKQEIVEFYTIVDGTKLKGLDKIMKWAVVNGREQLNKQLRRRYEIDLDTPTRAMRRESANFVDF